jgi:RNA polymerase sigma-70 factor, ECF subfamily
LRSVAAPINWGESTTMATSATPSAQPPIEQLYADLRTSLLGFLRKHTGDAHAAEDLLQDVVMKALAAGRSQATAPDNLTAWLYAVARNAAMDFHRRARPTEELPEDLADRADDGSQDYLELANCLRPMAERLPPKYRETVLAAEFDGRPLRELAQAEGVTLSAIKSRASRGRRLLQEELVSCCGVVLSPSGQVLDFDPTAARQCVQVRCEGK